MIDVFRVPLSKERLQAMPREERVLFFLLGYAGNQINLLRKLIIFASNHTPAEIIEQRITGASTQMLVRLLIGVVHETWLLISRRFNQTPVGRDIGPRLNTAGSDALRELKKAFGASNLIANLRNSYGFHFPRDDKEVDDAFDAAVREDGFADEWNLYPSPLLINSFNFAADLPIIHGICRCAGETNLIEAQQKIMTEVQSVASHMETFIGAFTDTLMAKYPDLAPAAEHTRRIEDAPNAFEVQIPFYVEPHG